MAAKSYYTPEEAPSSSSDSLKTSAAHLGRGQLWQGTFTNSPFEQRMFPTGLQNTQQLLPSRGATARPTPGYTDLVKLEGGRGHDFLHLLLHLLHVQVPLVLLGRGAAALGLSVITAGVGFPQRAESRRVDRVQEQLAALQAQVVDAPRHDGCLQGKGTKSLS